MSASSPSLRCSSSERNASLVETHCTRSSNPPDRFGTRRGAASPDQVPVRHEHLQHFLDERRMSLAGLADKLDTDEDTLRAHTPPIGQFVQVAS
jgi:hypothetical protein